VSLSETSPAFNPVTFPLSSSNASAMMLNALTASPVVVLGLIALQRWLSERFTNLTPSSGDGSVRTLGVATTKLTMSDVMFLIAQMVFKFIMMKLGLRPDLLSFVHLEPNGAPKRASSLNTSLPTYVLAMPLTLSQEDVRKYLRALDSQQIPQVATVDDLSKDKAQSIFADPAHLCLFLAAVSTPAFLVLLAQMDCPVQALGAVNVRNRFELYEPQLAHRIALGYMGSSYPDRHISARARLNPIIRRATRGAQIDIEVSITTIDLADDSKDVIIFKQVFTILQFLKWPEHIAADRNLSKLPKEGTDALLDLTVAQERDSTMKMDMDADDPRRWLRSAWTTIPYIISN
jgi:hypothetical protein